MSSRTRRSHRRTFVSRLESLESRTLFSAGDLDPTFGLGGIRSANIPGTEFENVTAIDAANGRVVVAGTIPQQDGTPNTQDGIALAVFDSNGNLLKSFSGDGIETKLLQAPGGVLDVAIQPDNKIVVLAGGEYDYTGTHVIARFNANGTLDTSFGGGDGQVLVGFGEKLTLALGGKIVVAGAQPNNAVAVARFTASGAADGQVVVRPGATLNDGEVYATVKGVVAQADGKILIAGQMRQADGGFADGFVARVKSDVKGLDTTYGGGDGVVVYDSRDSIENYDSVDAITLDAQGRAVLGVRLSGGLLSVRRLTTAGAADSSFTVTKLHNPGGARDINVAPDGKILLSGRAWYDGDFLFRANANGGVDATFGGGDGIRESFNGDQDPERTAGPFSKVLPDGKIITAGDSGSFFVARHVANNSTPVGTAVLGTDGIIRVTGTDLGHDDIFVADDGAAEPNGQIRVGVNGQQFAFARAQVIRVEVASLGGNDRVRDYSHGTTGHLPRKIDGGKGNDELQGGAGNDSLYGMDGNDRLFGGAGDDLIDGGTGTDLQDGGAGADTVDYSFRSSAIYVDLEGDADDGPAGEKDTVAANIEHILGGKGNDTLVGNHNPNYIRGGAGNDTIRGGGGNDTLVGDAGQDKLYGEAGDDFLNALDGITDLVLDGGPGNDTAKKDPTDPLINIEQLA